MNIYKNLYILQIQVWTAGEFPADVVGPVEQESQKTEGHPWRLVSTP